MVKLPFKSGYINRPEYIGEIHDGENLVEVRGFIPVKKRIENIINAGMRLDAARKEMYDFPDGDDDGGDFDPSRNPGTDPVDAQAAFDRLKASIAAKQAKTAAEKSQQTVPKVDEQTTPTV
jgi:hypothetical protein